MNASTICLHGILHCDLNPITPIFYQSADFKTSGKLGRLTSANDRARILVVEQLAGLRAIPVWIAGTIRDLEGVCHCFTRAWPLLVKIGGSVEAV